MRGAFLILALASFLAAPAHAQDFTVSEDDIRACFASVPIGEIDPDCLGKAANQCQSQPGGQTTIGVSQCLAAETKVWDAILNEEYVATRDDVRVDEVTGVAPPIDEALFAAQSAWIAFRDAECDLAFARWSGGSIRAIVHANCMMVFTARRAIELRDMREGAF